MRLTRFPLLVAACIVLAGGFCFAADEAADSSPGDSEKANDAYTTESLRGRVVWLADALARLYDVRTTQDAKQRVLALETDDGDLVPLVEDRRGRSFRKDERLRDRDVELLVRRYRGVPLAQVIRIHAIKPDGKYLLDYWCDICAISMVELGPCDCCQGPIELRERKVE
jgi:hypothetical protein